MRRFVIAFAMIASFAGRAAADEIKEILVEGNTKTTNDTVELISQIDVGDDWTPEMVDTIKQRLVSSGLFSDVEVFWDPGPDGVRVHMMVKDKHSWIIAPAFYNQPTNIGGGVGFGENNLFGYNQKLLLYGQIATGDSFFIGAWVIPALGGTRFYAQPDMFLRYSRNIEYAAPTKYRDNPEPVRISRLTYLNAGFKLGVELIRGFKIDARLRAAKVGYSDVHLADGATPDQVGATDPTMIPAPGMEGWDVSSEYTFTIDRRANWYGVYTGHRYQLSYEFGVPQLGSDFHYHRFGLQLYRAVQVFERHNFVTKGSLQIGHHMPFQQELLTGGTAMRGWLNNQFRGDFQALTNVEYSLPMFTIAGLSVRGLAFWDSAYTTFLTTSNPERNYLPSSQFDSGRFGAGFKNSIGLGTRLYLRQIVLPLLGLDVGYGLEAGDVQIYLAIGLTD